MSEALEKHILNIIFWKDSNFKKYSVNYIFLNLEIAVL